MMVLKTDIGNSRVSPQIPMPLKHLQSFFIFLYRLAPFFILFGNIKAERTFEFSLFNFLLLFFFQFLSGHPGFVKEIFSREEHEIKTSQLWLYINRIIALGICTVLGNFLMAALAF